MLDVSVHPSHLVTGRQTRMTLRFVNTDRGPCTNIVFRLDLPFGLTLIDGQSKVEIPSIPAGGTHIHAFTVMPTKSDDFTLTSGNFSYRDQYGVSEYPDAFRWRLHAAADATPIPTSPRPAPRLAVRLEDAEAAIPAGTWREIRILVRNPSDVIVRDVRLDLNGPLRINGAQQRASQLRPGTTAGFTFSVVADEGGRVPVGVSTAFTYPDGVGSVRHMVQDDSLLVQVTARPPASASRPASEPVRSILFLSACPDDSNRLPPDYQDVLDNTCVPLRTDLEMRDVEEQLLLSRQQGKYQIKYQPAARWKDISRTLAYYRPSVVHFSGHGDREGNLVIESDGGGAELVTPEWVARLFSVYKPSIECVFVNACYSERLAQAVFKNIDNVIGMRWQVGDQAAIQFSIGFYTGYFNGLPVSDAFEQGLTHIGRLEATGPESRTPLLLTRG